MKKTKKIRQLLPYDTSNPKNPVWELYRDGITFSGLSKWLECREQFRLGYVCGWTPTRLSEPLEFGSIFHHCLEHEARARKNLTAVLKAYRTSRFREITVADGPLFEKQITLAQALIPEYFDYYRKDPEKNWVQREQQFRMDYDLGGELVPIVGKMDGVLRIVKKLWLFETKTKSRIDEGAISLSLKMDFQTLLYSLAVQDIYGDCPSGVVYNVIRKPGHKQGKAEKTKDFVKRLRKAISDDPSYFYKRWEVSLQKSDIESFQQTVLNPILSNFVDWNETTMPRKNPFDSHTHYLNPNNLIGRYGASPFLNLITTGSKSRLKERKKAHPELD